VPEGVAWKRAVTHGGTRKDVIEGILRRRLGGRMAKLNRSIQMSIQALLKALKDHTERQWSEIAEFFEEGFVDESGLAEMAKTKQKGSPDERPNTPISREFAVKLIKICKSVEGFEPPSELVAKLASLWDPPAAAAEAETSENGAEAGAPKPKARRSLISAVGITDNIAEKTIRQYNGDYLQFSLDESFRIVTTRYGLTKTVGDDDAPILRAARNYPNRGLLKSSGAYFRAALNLYLVASPSDALDLRMSVFNVMPRDDDQDLTKEETQKVLRGLLLGVSLKNDMFNSRCVLISAASVSKEVEEALWIAPLDRSSFDKVKSLDDEVELAKLSAFLFGEETVDFIKLLTPMI
jgi:hypothetical protein